MNTLFDKIWDAHVVQKVEDGPTQLYIDRLYCHEVTSPQAFEGLRARGLRCFRPEKIFCMPDHNTPTHAQDKPIEDPVSRTQVDTLAKNAEEFGLTHFGMMSPKNGIIHVVGPERGLTLPGMTIVCGDSHTSTHGAMGAVAFGIGTSEVEHVMATQTLLTKKMKNMLVKVDGKLKPGVFGKDLALAVIGKIGTAAGTGYAIEFAGSAIRELSMEGRMTLCNMAIEAGARCGIVAVDEKTIEYMKGRPLAPEGKQWDHAVEYWKTLHSDEGANFDTVIEINASEIVPMVTWGTSPEMVAPITGSTPLPENQPDPVKREGWERAYKYMGLEPGTQMTEIYPNSIFIGSCTNGRIEDLRAAAYVVKKLGKKVAPNIKLALVVPGSGLVREIAEKEGLDQIFIQAGFEWRRPGCSMCLAMNADKLSEGDRCASTSNRNFEGRQGNKSRTHLCSPAMAAAAAIEGHFVDVRKIF